jgi:hypothetical protein
MSSPQPSEIGGTYVSSMYRNRGVDCRRSRIGRRFNRISRPDVRFEERRKRYLYVKTK